MRRSGGRTRNCARSNWSSVSGALESFIDLIVGRGLADQRDTARYERDSSSVQAWNKTVTSIDYESRPPTTTPTKGEKELLLERTASVAGTIPKQGSVQPPRVRTQKPQPAPEEYISPCGPPDISCADIPEEQISRTYSQSCIWDPKTNPVPPLQEMEGFGRFRRSVHADADWELSKFRGDLQTLGPAAVQHLGDFEIARLKRGVMNNIRTPSFASLTSYSDSGDSSTGTRICRGFNSSKSPSAANSSKDCNGLASCTKSHAKSPDLNVEESGQLRPHSKRVSFLRFDAVPALLTTIDETTDTPQRKKTVPLIFDARGTADEVIEDDEYESCEESFAPAGGPAKADQHRAVGAVLKWHEKKAHAPQIKLPNSNRIRGTRHYRTFDHVPERARIGQKKPSKPVTRRLSSRGAKALVNRETSKENIPRVVETKMPDGAKIAPSTTSHPPLEVFLPKASPTSSEESADLRPTHLDMYVGYLKPSTTGFTEDKILSNHSNSTGRVVDPDASHCSRSSTTQGRNRSQTVIRVLSGNIPVAYIEGEVKQILDIGKHDGMNLQAVAA